ncbi:DUF3772 domain-containing protein [Roseobacter weihaiensis]|uniref:DUF3772 domain-containing protein n=1 Tax=Roseobacter weihaiensis TaxID=2763262 RepID=UPI001D0AC148|nr:DUF3772 domain-containing protein [Roseobacter sp. H9]
MRQVLRVFLVGLLVVWSAMVQAQDSARDENDPLYPFWDEFAETAEQRIDGADDSSVEELEDLRSRIVIFRTEFANGRQANADRIATLQSQIAALGPVPETGTEAEEITARRTNLEQQLEELQAPVRVADSAFRRADGLIGEIDAIVRERQTRRLLALGPSPLDPRNWPVAVEDTRRIFLDIRNDAYDLSEPGVQQQFRDQAPLVLLLLLMAVTLIVKGGRWASIAVEYMRRWGGRGSGVWSFLVSLLRIFLPLIGLMLLAYALRLTGVLGEKIDNLVGLLPVWGLILLGFRWLAERLYARNDDDVLIGLASEKRKASRFYMMILSLLFVSRGIIAVIFDLEDAQPETIAVVAFPIVVLMGAILFIKGLMLRKSWPVETGEAASETKGGGLARFLRIVGTGMIVVGVAAPIMAGIGYSEAGNALLYPTVLSLVLLGLVLVLQRFTADVYGLVSGQGSEARDGLAAILAGFVLVLIALPLLALTWGVRVTDLTELWSRFLRGFEIGGTRISPSDFLTFAIVFVVGYTITRVLQGTLRQNVLPKTRLDIGGQNAMVSGLGYVGIFLSALIAVTVAGVDLSAFAIVAGALSVGIGFGLQTIVSNFVSGIILLVERPISEGDWIEVGGQMGYVKHISVRSTRIETFDRTDVIVPNSDLISGTVTNYTRGNTVGRLIVPVGVAYGTDTKHVDKILREVAEAQPMILNNPPPSVLFMGFGADSLDFEIRAILRDVNWILTVRNDINHAIAARFAEEGIEIPFAQRDIWLRNPEALRPEKDGTQE